MADEAAATATTVQAEAADRLATLVLFAEFDIDKGSTLRESFPQAVPHYSPEFFADVMLPEGVHNRKEDFTVFFLNRQSARKTQAAGEEVLTAESDPLREFMYCLSVVHTIHDASARRGATVKAVALCSRHKCCFSFRGVLDVAVAKVAEAKTGEDVRGILEQLYNVVNSVDAGSIRSLSDMERRFMKRTISSTGRAAANLADAKEIEEAQFFRTQLQWQDKTIPLQFKLCSTEDQHDNGLLTKLLLKFGEQTMIIYNAVLMGARVLILGYNQPAGEVCNYVLSTSSLVCPPLFGLIHRQFPYANLTDLGFLSTPGYIAGVTNPMFKTKKEWWDVLCDISTGEVVVSTPVEKDDYESSDRVFVQEVLDGIGAGYDEEWVRCMFEEYTRKNVVDIAMGEANYMDEETQVKRTAMNNKRITKWARTDNYKLFTDARKRRDFLTPAFNVDKTSVDLKKHIRSLQGDMVVLDDAQVERIYTDFVSLLKTEQELQEFLSHLPVLRGGLQTIAQGIFHQSIGVKYNTVILLKRLEKFPSTASSLHRLNAFLLMSYQRIHSIVAPEVRD